MKTSKNGVWIVAALALVVTALGSPAWAQKQRTRVGHLATLYIKLPGKTPPNQSLSVHKRVYPGKTNRYLKGWVVGKEIRKNGQVYLVDPVFEASVQPDFQDTKPIIYVLTKKVIKVPTGRDGARKVQVKTSIQQDGKPAKRGYDLTGFEVMLGNQIPDNGATSDGQFLDWY